jgi:hypothetical protein
VSLRCKTRHWFTGFNFPKRGLNGTQGLMVLVLGILNVLRGLTYFVDPPKPNSFPFLLQVAMDNWPWLHPLYFGVIWVIVGLIAMVYGFRFHDSVATGLLVLMYTGWGLSYIGGWIYAGVTHGPPTRDYSLFMIYTLLVGFLLFWNGDRKGVK